MIFRLHNQEEPERTLSLTGETWIGILDLAEQYGWCTYGDGCREDGMEETIPLAGVYLGKPLPPRPHEYHSDHKLVPLEEALNLADFLEQAFLEYEPRRVPVSYYVFEPVDHSVEVRPSIGAIWETIEFCRMGAFWVENRTRGVYS